MAYIHPLSLDFSLRPKIFSLLSSAPGLLIKNHIADFDIFFIFQNGDLNRVKREALAVGVWKFDPVDLTIVTGVNFDRESGWAGK